MEGYSIYIGTASLRYMSQGKNSNNYYIQLWRKIRGFNARMTGRFRRRATNNALLPLQWYHACLLLPVFVDMFIRLGAIPQANLLAHFTISTRICCAWSLPPGADNGLNNFLLGPRPYCMLLPTCTLYQVVYTRGSLLGFWS